MTISSSGIPNESNCIDEVLRKLVVLASWCARTGSQAANFTGATAATYPDVGTNWRGPTKTLENKGFAEIDITYA